MHQIEFTISHNRLHQLISHANRQVEVAKRQLIPRDRGVVHFLAYDEIENVWVVTPQDAHLGTTARTGRHDCRTHGVEYFHVADRAAGETLGFCNPRTFGPDHAEIVANTAPKTHGLRSLAGRIHDSWNAVHRLENRISKRLNKTVHPGGADARKSCRGVNSPPQDRVIQRLTENLLPFFGVDFIDHKAFGYSVHHLFRCGLSAVRVLLDE